MQNTENEITEDDLSLTDADMADKIRAIMAAKYGLIAVSEPVLHVAVASAAALNYITGELRQHHKKQTDDLSVAHQQFRDSISDTLLYFENSLVKTIQKAVTETSRAHIEEFRIISEKQTAQLRHIIDNRPASGQPGVINTTTPQPHNTANWLYISAAALTGATVALLAALCVL